MKLVRFSIAYALVVAAISFFVCGCANQTIKQDSLRSANTVDSRAKLKTFEVRLCFARVGPITDTAHNVMGTITINLENNQILWQSALNKPPHSIPLRFVKPNKFFVEENRPNLRCTAVLEINGQSSDGKNVSITRDSNDEGQIRFESGQTRNGSFDEFFSYFNQLKFPENYHGLIASGKYVDGTPIKIGYEFPASIQITVNGCALNGKIARVYRLTLTNGNGVIVEDNGDSKVVLWPNGNWVFYNLNNSGTSFYGKDTSLVKTYPDLRKLSEDSDIHDVQVTDSSSKVFATGFFITDDGYLISNYHVVKGAVKVRLLTGTGLIDATVVKVDAANDIALLKAVGTFKPLPIAASRTVKLGGSVATVGFPSIGLQGFSPKLAKGEIASLAGAADDPRYFQISVPVQPGNSGGALVDERGNVVGIVSAKLSAKAALDATGQLPENVNYAVKSSLLLSFLESVPDVAAKLKEPNTKDESFEEVVKSAQAAAVLVLVY